MLLRRTIVPMLLMSLIPAVQVAAESNQQALQEDKNQVQQWNKFAKICLQAHKRRVSTNQVTTSERKGGYRGRPNFYNEITYKDANTGKMISRIQWETESPDDVHVIELFDYDNSGRVIRDYTAAYLPGPRNAPVQTLAAFHAYNGDLHAFRSFDATGEAVFESCSGNLNGESVDISLEDYQIEDVRKGIEKLGSTPEYQTCFKGLPLKPGEKLYPQ